ncbi:hypothetical protein [Aureibaculum luteum]|uniref:hypothetical protein n=1 Tax=Aureibaculum luteum TaxID=1548456 RepID=UPI000E46E808|nr:hypothetical protein [Aureibaculum luteum]
MNPFNEKAYKFIKLELIKAEFEVLPNESGREGVNFSFKTNNGNLHELYLQPINLDSERKVKIPKQKLGEPKDNLWVALVFMMDNEPFNAYLIPSKTVTTPDDYIFLENEVNGFPHLSNWETEGSRTPIKLVS